METILIIEDTCELRESIAEVLTLEGYQVIQADSGTRGIELARQHLPDLILCDIMMPGADGYEVLKNLKNENEQGPFAFIYMSALEDRKSIRDGMSLGADDYLPKPFTIDELLTAVRIRLEKQSSVEYRIKSRIESIEKELQNGISTLQTQLASQKSILDVVMEEKVLVTGQLKEKQDQLMQDALRAIEINSIFQEMSAQLTTALQTELTIEQRTTLTRLRNKLRNRSILLNNQTLFLFKFDQTYPNFKYSMLSKYPKLKKHDLVLLAAMYIHLDTSQLATILNISSESVRKKRYRLKLKMDLGKEVELADVIHQFKDR